MTLYVYIHVIHVNERCKRKEESSKQRQTNNKAKQYSTSIVQLTMSHTHPIVNESCLHLQSVQSLVATGYIDMWSCYMVIIALH